MKEKTRPLGYPSGKPWPAWRRGEEQEPCASHYPTRIKITGGSTVDGVRVVSGHCLDCGAPVKLREVRA